MIKLIDILTEKEKRIYQKNWQGAPPKGAKVMTGPRGGKYYMGAAEKGRPDKGDRRGTKADTEKRGQGGEVPTRTKKGDVDKAIKLGKDIEKAAGTTGTDAETPKTKDVAKQVSKYGARQQGVGAGLDNLKGPKSDADAVGPSAKKEQEDRKSVV